MALANPNEIVSPRPTSAASGILKAVGLRLLYGLLSLIFISLVVFLADEVSPGDAATVLAGDKATQERVERLRTEMGLSRPWPVRYVEFFGKAVKLDFGRSYFGQKRNVREMIFEKLPVTAMLALSAILIAVVVGLTMGTIAAIYRTRPPDTLILILSTLGVTVPTFVLAPALVWYFSSRMDLLPPAWEVNLRGPLWMYLVLPVGILAARPSALLTRVTRASMIETLQQEFIRTAIAKGVPPGRLIIRHALRNAVLPVITVVGTSFGFLLTGSFVLETIFTIPGIGQEGIDAIAAGDMPRIQGIVLTTGVMFLLLNLLVDILLPILDPRIREVQV